MSALTLAVLLAVSCDTAWRELLLSNDKRSPHVTGFSTSGEWCRKQGHYESRSALGCLESLLVNCATSYFGLFGSSSTHQIVEPELQKHWHARLFRIQTPVVSTWSGKT